jgi:hypothetical protein
LACRASESRSSVLRDCGVLAKNWRQLAAKQRKMTPAK